jgi:hypothetical protein
VKRKFKRQIKNEGFCLYPLALKSPGWAIKRTSTFDNFSWFVASLNGESMAELMFSFKYEAENYRKFKMEKCSDIKDEIVRVVMKEVCE